MNVPEEFGSRVPGGRAAGAMPPAKERRPLEATADEGARPGTAKAAEGAPCGAEGR